ncbi:hypothetical protein EYZ11_005431 [Aspergillus tanneri]|uniref:Methyltransferase domain-containing protein n=1 Tax=Aspergillus tanneri TaxID=1220188 RepID=A0A4S3JKE9_9EURO|nr:uncharacterized protein ATNIH1004_010619 [Aspergillus tanneri]KAA8643844.1 hypothetical protein ATNIH1004_010619 [Aspergillus tanneri]THC95107.1 hypothetical protein EYZ11_005431 [Aspergillus tanneri]
MPSQYDTIGARYNSISSLPVVKLEEAAVEAHIGNVNQLKVLDIACGSGRYSRKLISWGAREVVGLDNSESMLDAARLASKGDERLKFRNIDCSKPFDMGQFDLVFASWFLNYAANEDEMVVMWKNIFNSLKPRRKCIGITPNQDLLHCDFPNGPTFGQTLTPVEKVDGGVRNQIELHTSPPIIFRSYTLKREIYERSARKAGLCDLQWLPLPAIEDPSVPYTDLLECPHMQVFVVSRY